ncbi:TetR family transcriptional regulator [Longispora fulva]|uniref:AcrR family transcriptional regulator n=1 Tax=Longispora fulva TaxID=619741 RepID=A0A8J7KGH3_9ACTN|nr:TetR family transcriptional regulator [Longispora fulva]MBG6137370.1 AcrR family transcriptional regulator [Longispora fulva]GIG61276.1 TetR family transcriptional regulator [Longispora fulva]
METASLRERKKQRTREALVDAAFDLFQRKGYEAATVDEIADSVEVSARTFFRYFESKDDLLLSIQEQQFALLFDLIRARPAHEAVLDVVRHAAVEVVRAAERGTHGFDPEKVSCMQALMAASPALAARCRAVSAVRTDELAGCLAARMGVLADDRRAYLVASMAITAIQVAMTWHEADRGRPLSDNLDEAFELLAAGINYPAAK